MQLNPAMKHTYFLIGGSVICGNILKSIYEFNDRHFETFEICFARKRFSRWDSRVTLEYKVYNVIDSRRPSNEDTLDSIREQIDLRLLPCSPYIIYGEGLDQSVTGCRASSVGKAL